MYISLLIIESMHVIRLDGFTNIQHQSKYLNTWTFVQFGRGGIHDGFGFLFMAERRGTWCGLLLLQLIHLTVSYVVRLTSVQQNSVRF